MSDVGLDFADYLVAHDLQAEIVAPGVHMPTVDAAAAAMGVPPAQIFKSILFQSPAGRCVLVVASGNARVDVRRVEALTGIANSSWPSRPWCSPRRGTRREARRRWDTASGSP